MNLKRAIIVMLAAAFCGTPAFAQDGCPVQQRNQNVLREADDYLGTKRGANYDSVHGGTYRVRRGFYADVYSGLPRSDANVKPSEVDYLQAPIETPAAIQAAAAQAARLSKSGQTSLANSIRVRIAAISKEMYGQKLNTQQMLCLSTAEQLRKSAWSLFTHQAYPLAEKSYRGVIEIYQKELGDDIATANATGELARVLDAKGKHTEALAAYAKADAIFRAQPTRMNADSASVLEAYAELLSQEQKSTQASLIYDEARLARKNAYKSRIF